MDHLAAIAQPFASRTLLLVDDQKSVLSTLKELFGERGHTVLPAESGAASLALLQQHAIDVALVDLHMPGMDGIHVCRQILAHAAHTQRPIRVWLMAAAYTDALSKRGLEAGAVALLKKPFDWRALANEIEAVNVTAPAPPSCFPAPSAHAA